MYFAKNAAIWAMSCSYFTFIPSLKIQTTDQPLLKCIQEKKNKLHQKNLFQDMFWRFYPHHPHPVAYSTPLSVPTAMDPVSPCACLNKTLICHSQQHLQELMPTKDLSQEGGVTV